MYGNCLLVKIVFVFSFVFIDNVVCHDKEILVKELLSTEKDITDTTTNPSNVEITDTTIESIELTTDNINNENEFVISQREDEDKEADELPLPETETSSPKEANSSLNDYYAYLKDYPDYLEEEEEFDEEDLSVEGEEVKIPEIDQPIVFRQDCQCGLPIVSRIVGGATTEIKKYPWNVQIVVRKNSYPFCGGTIINEFYILTAAHCLEDLTANDLAVRVGHTSSTDPGIIINAEHIRMHEGYKKNNPIIHDIGLLKLEKALEYTDKIMPACLLEKNNYQSQTGVVTGWGAVSEKGGYSDILKAAYVQIYEFQTCRKISRYRKSHIHGAILCARRKKTDACQGDSGGPLVHYDATVQRFAVVGITSYGIGCARYIYPGVYTKVPVYRPWIIQHTANTTYCPV